MTSTDGMKLTMKTLSSASSLFKCLFKLLSWDLTFASSQPSTSLQIPPARPNKKSDFINAKVANSRVKGNNYDIRIYL